MLVALRPRWKELEEIEKIPRFSVSDGEQIYVIFDTVELLKAGYHPSITAASDEIIWR